MSREKEFNTKYSPEFKIAVIMDMRENNLSYRETARKYGLVKRSMGGAKSVEEDLISENQRLKERIQYLEAENEYIKKLSALVYAEEQKSGKKRK